ATQQLSEWCNGIGSTAVSILTHFMSLQADIETNQDHKDFANNLLSRLAFLYGSATEDGHLKQPFQSELFIQVLVQHRCTTLGAVDSHRKITHAKGALSLATVAACIFTFSSYHNQHISHVSDGIELEVNSRGKAVKIPHSLNKASGKTSNARKAFSDTNYGVATRGYMKSINCMKESVLQDV
ncbi:hypothetical protein BDR06DRAFT_878067, partial [Suillus hirtellus]